MPDLLAKFELDQKRRGLSANTIQLRRRQFDLYEREVGKIEHMSAESVQVWLDGRKISDKTRSCYLTTFSAFFKWALKHDYLTVDPIAKIDRPKVHNGMPNPIPEEALARAIKACTNPMLKCWIVIEAYAGLRCQEVAYLEHHDIQVDKRYDKTGKLTSLGRIHVRFGKGNKQRYVPLTQSILDALDAYEAPTETGRLWPFAKPSGVSQRINRYFHGMGITHTAHKNRHRYGTQLYRTSGESLLVVQHALGHSDPKTSSIYAQVDDESLTTAAMLIA